MGLAYTNSDHTRVYTSAYVYRNPSTTSALNWSQDGEVIPDATGITQKYCPQNPPFGLGAGKSVDSTGTFLYQPELGSPVDQFVVLNDGPQILYAGVNVRASGSWVIADGLAIASGQSFEFGQQGTQIIRDVWAITSTASSTVQGYATNQPSYPLQ